MTTIAYHHVSRRIAVDGRSTRESGIITTDCANKIEVVEGVVFILCGVACDHDLFMRMYFGEKSDMIPECNAFAIDKGVVYRCGCSEGGVFWRQKCTNNDALGSGTQWAIAAMDFGRSAKEAVEYACTRDCFSGGVISEIGIDDIQ